MSGKRLYSSKIWIDVVCYLNILWTKPSSHYSSDMGTHSHGTTEFLPSHQAPVHPVEWEEVSTDLSQFIDPL